MKKSSLTTFVLGALIAVPAFSQDTTVESRGVRIVGEGYGKSDFGGDLRPFNWNKGTSLAVLVQHPKGGLIEIDEDASSFTEFTDDKGTNLAGEKDKFGRDPIDISFPSVSKDGKAALVTVTSTGLPTKGATTLSLKGELVATTGSKKEKVKSEATALKKDGTLKVGEFTFNIKKIGKPDYGDEPLSIDLQVKGDVDKIASWAFLKPDGTEIKSASRGSSWMTFGNIKDVTKTFALGEKVDSVILQLELWQDRKKVKIPVDLKVTMGL